MKLKLDENGNVVVIDGKPVYVHDDGKEVAFDALNAVTKISELNKEAKAHRERAESAESKLAVFKDIENPEEAIKALSIVKNLDQKKLVDAGEIEKVKQEAIKSVEDKYAPVVKERDTFRDQLYTEKIGGSFARSKLIAEKLAIPSDLVQAKFGGAFKVEERPGEVANFDEALEVLIDQYPHKESILKGAGAAGSGAGGSGGASGGQKSISRSAFDSLDPASQMKHVKDGGKITD
jgi:hypothetical protein